MSRLVKADFEEILDFLKKYSLEASLNDEEFSNLISQCHKKYFGLMIFLNEMFALHPGSNKKGSKTSSRITYTQNLYLQEFVSDIGGALFNWSHGAYKSSRLLLRSSIENFAKGLAISEFPSIITKTSVYEVFDLASTANTFSDHLPKLAFNRLRGLYQTLCADAHGSILHLEHTKSLNYFPGFEPTKATSTAQIFCSISKDALTVLALNKPDVLRAMHYTNTDVILPMLSKATKRKLHGLD